MAFDLGSILDLVGSGIGLYENIDKNNQMNELIRQGTNTSDITGKQLGASKSLFDALYANDPATQRDLAQFDTQFAQPSADEFRPAYGTASQRFQQGDAYSPETLRGLLQDKARRGISDAYDNVTNTTAMQALRTGTNAAETMKELAKQRAKDTSAALSDAELQSITGSQSMNLAQRDSNTKGLTAAGNPLAELLKTRAVGGAGLLGGGAQTRDTATRGVFNNIQSGYGSEAAARSGAVPGAMGQLSEQPYASGFMLGGQALNNLIKPAPKTGANYPNGNSGELMF